MPEFSYQSPADIDGEPAQVSELSVRQVGILVDQLTECLDLAGVQVRNAVMQEVVEDNGGDPTEGWEESKEASYLVRAKGAISTAAKLIAQLQEETRVG